MKTLGCYLGQQEQLSGQNQDVKFVLQVAITGITANVSFEYYLYWSGFALLYYN